MLLQQTIDLSTAKDLYGRLITLGDIIAHCFSIGSVEAVLSTLGGLIEELDAKLENITERWDDPSDPDDVAVILNNKDKTIASVKKLFDIRHILVHELPDKLPYTHDDILMIIDETKVFLDAIG